MIASRYGSPSFDIASVKDIPQGLHLTIEVLAAESATTVSSQTHQIVLDEIMTGKGKAADSWTDFAAASSDEPSQSASRTLLITTTTNLFLEKDFVLDIRTGSNTAHEKPRAWLEEHPTFTGHKALMLDLPFGCLSHQSEPMPSRTEILFLVDRSGSMEDKIESLRSALRFFLKGIPIGKKFNIWSFGSSYTSWRPRSVEYSKDTLNAALSYISRDLKANMGGTEILPAIEAMIAARDVSLLTNAIVLTDGEVWRLDDTLQCIREARLVSEHKMRFFSLGVGDEVSHALVEGIAVAGGGYAEVIPSSSLEGWEDRVVAMTKAALTTSPTGPVRVVLERMGSSMGDKFDLNYLRDFPSHTKDSDDLGDNRVYRLLEQPLHIGTPDTVSVITRIWNGKEVSMTVPIEAVGTETTIHTLAARSILKDLETQLHQLEAQHDTHESRGKLESISRQAEGLARKWCLASKWTSFFVSDADVAQDEDREDAEMRTDSFSRLLRRKSAQNSFQGPQRRRNPRAIIIAEPWDAVNEEVLMAPPPNPAMRPRYVYHPT